MAGLLVGFSLSVPLLNYVTPRTALLWSAVIRILAAVAYVGAVLLDSPSTIYIIYASRFVHGATLYNLTLSSSWVGIRLPAERKMTPLQLQVPDG